jgi:tetratricopeptide (TPR) repeat protein
MPLRLQSLLRAQAALGLAVVAASLASHSAVAQPAAAPPAAESTRLDAAFARVMQNPSDAEAAFAYARAAVEAGQPQAAIAALERVLRVNPRLDNIRLELASLYLAVGQPDLAAVAAREAIASPDIPPEVADRARRLLAQADQGSSRSRFSGTIFAGARYDTNANAQPTGPVVFFSRDGGRFVAESLPPGSAGASSWSSVLSGRFNHQYDLGLQREGTLETNLSLYDQRYARIPRPYDIFISEIDVGPRIGVATFEGGNLALRPFATATMIAYEDSFYAGLYGGGLTAEAKLADRWTVGLTGIYQGGNYRDSGFRPRARDYNGTTNSLALSVSYDFGPTTRATLTVGRSEATTRQQYLDFTGPFAQFSVGSTFTIGTYQFGAAVRVGWRQFNYGGPDASIDPTVTRRTKRGGGGATLVLPITGQIAATVEFDYLKQTSNIPNYAYDNYATVLGLRYGF